MSIAPWLVIQNDDGQKYRNNLTSTGIAMPYGTCSAEVNNVGLGDLYTGEHVTNELTVRVTSKQASKVVFTSKDLDADGVLHFGNNNKILVTTIIKTSTEVATGSPLKKASRYVYK